MLGAELIQDVAIVLVAGSSLEEMMDTAWRWELKLKQDEQFFSSAKSELN